MCECELQATARTHMLTEYLNKQFRICTHAEKCLIILIFQNRCLDFIFSSDVFAAKIGKDHFSLNLFLLVSVSSIAKHSMQNILK